MSIRQPSNPQTLKSLFYSLILRLKMRPLYLLSASSVNLHGTTNTIFSHNNLRIRLSPVISPGPEVIKLFLWSTHLSIKF